ncbi:hypothetical protein AGABI1DRAFT_130149 [Agaricus bisporus var. burnettii JB137-S8]|uniref:Uncharacterized protein n=1 Tax=Agaricus bisporus var. burnettii (strain JB137-S8 / ATCC MYA-4627 / FGSC 10392) TaxID=597362 RepID=K5X4K0_AGABU|nr:uncharacterized protein AGABI1DRAFT_130149 [Agaricus bisporus var. burnettii JB137-S8]EKM77872.1 hypothetical protein AGABI1DRAFT_130149 [Agaricus bisporus var. burnettii JB137-S8]
MPAQRKKQSIPAPAPHLSRLPSQTPPPPANPTATHLAGIAPVVAFANAKASALAKGKVKGPSGHSTGISAALPAVNTLPSVPPTSEPSPAPAPPIPSPPRAPSPLASVLSSNDDSSMALDYEAVTPRPGSPAEPVDNKSIVEQLCTSLDGFFDIIHLFSDTKWRREILKDFPALMDNELDGVQKHFTDGMKEYAHLILLAVVNPQINLDY